MHVKVQRYAVKIFSRSTSITDSSLNKLKGVFHASVLLVTMNFVITLSK